MYVIPETLKLIKRRLAVLKRYAAGGEEQARQATSQMRSLENSLKAYLGEYGGLLDKTLIAKKQKEESDFRAGCRAKPELASKYRKGMG